MRSALVASLLLAASACGTEPSTNPRTCYQRIATDLKLVTVMHVRQVEGNTGSGTLHYNCPLGGASDLTGSWTSTTSSPQFPPHLVSFMGTFVFDECRLFIDRGELSPGTSMTLSGTLDNVTNLINDTVSMHATGMEISAEAPAPFCTMAVEDTCDASYDLVSVSMSGRLCGVDIGTDH